MIDAPQSTRRNWRIFMLLEMVPEFRKDVANLRAKHGIPIRGYITDYERSPYRHEYDRAAEERSNKDAIEKIKALGHFLDTAHTAPLRKPHAEMRLFQKDIFKIGEKFRLAYNLYHSSNYGLAWLIVRNRVAVPERNWEIEADLIYQDRPLPLRHASIRAYMPLDDAESSEAIAELNNVLRGHLPKQLGENRRMHKRSEKQLSQVESLLETTYGQDDWVPKSDRERKQLERADALARELFGYGIHPDSNDVR